MHTSTSRGTCATLRHAALGGAFQLSIWKQWSPFGQLRSKYVTHAIQVSMSLSDKANFLSKVLDICIENSPINRSVEIAGINGKSATTLRFKQRSSALMSSNRVKELIVMWFSARLCFCVAADSSNETVKNAE
ncbi:MAG: hypothetical protein AAF922_21135 [Pseudomonadota bacterium]